MGRPRPFSAIGIVLACTLALTPVVARATPSQTGLELSQGCAIVGKSEASSVLGFEVQTPDASTTTGGVCTFPSLSISQEGVVSYAIVTTADVIARASYFRLLAVRCANVDARAPNAAQCGTFRKLAFAKTAADYYAARASTPEALPQPALGDAAVSTPTALFVLRGAEVFECVVRRDEFLDVDRATALASLLLARVAPIDAPPAPAPSQTP